MLMQKNHSSVLAMNFIILILGMVLLTQFYTLLFQNNFSTIGWKNFLDHLLQYNEAGSLKYKLIIFLKQTAPFSTCLFAAGLFVSALGCITLLARSYICIAVAIGFFIAWSFTWNDPGMWPFEFAFPAIFALLAGLSTRHLSLTPHAVFSQSGFSITKKLLSIILLSILLYAVTFLAFDKPDFANKVALSSAFSFFIICLASSYRKKSILEKDKQGRIEKYLDYMIIIIGSMFLLQVYINYFSGVFELTNFRESITYFAKNTNATFLKKILLLSADYSQWILPPYILFEIFLSLSLTLLFVRGPILLISAGLLGFLTFAELGISATWPPTPNNLTWEWELLFVTLAAIIIGVQKTLSLKENFSLKKLLFGAPLDHYPLITALLISAMSGIILYFIGWTAQGFIGDSYRITAIFSGVTFAILIFILLITNRFRG